MMILLKKSQNLHNLIYWLKNFWKGGQKKSRLNLNRDRIVSIRMFSEE